MITPVAHDVTDGAASAVVRAYTANPSALGTQVGPLAARKVTLDPAATPGNQIGVLIAPPLFGKPWSLNGAADFLCLNFNGGAIAGVSLSVDVVFRER